jgi:hypothetical protein
MDSFDDKLAEAERIWADGPRKFSVGDIYTHVVNPAIRREKNGLPVSRFLPLRAGGTVVTDGGRKIKVHPDGMRTDLRGRPIVATKADQRRVEVHYGVERE